MAVITVDAISQRTILGGGDGMIVVSVRLEVMNSTVCLLQKIVIFVFNLFLKL